MISTKGRYALRVLIDIAENQGTDYIPLKSIAARQDISEKYLESIIKILVQNNVVVALRGKGGGYRLTLPADQINVDDILIMTEGDLSPVACLAPNAAPCERMSSCRTLMLWNGLNNVVHDYLRQYTIADLVARPEDGFNYVI